jgi:hypothetical protein
MSAHTAANDDQVVVIFGCGSLGNNCQTLAPADPGGHLPADMQKQHEQQKQLMQWQFHGPDTLQCLAPPKATSIMQVMDIHTRFASEKHAPVDFMYIS